MTFGEEGKEQSRVFTTEACQEILDVFKSHGESRETARCLYDRFLSSLASEEFHAILQTESS